jgi:uncharacterized protein
MKAKLYLIPIALLSIAVLAACAPAATTATAPQTRTISVNGTGIITLTPDMAEISIGVSSQGPEATAVVNENNRLSQQVMDTLTSQGIAAEDLTTTNFSIYPQQNYDQNGQPTSITYIVQNTVQVKVRDLTKLGDLLDAVVQSGANNINSIQFDVADRETATQQAMQVAVANAKSRAEVLAQAAGVALGDAQSISTSISGSGPVVQYDRALAVTQASVPISAGSMTISVDVSVVYEIK